MKKIKPSEITDKLTQEQLEILAEMLEGDSANNGWVECYNRLSDYQISQVHDKLGKLIRKRDDLREASLSEEQRLQERKKREEWFKKASEDPDGFYGNMSNPE